MFEGVCVNYCHLDPWHVSGMFLAERTENCGRSSPAEDRMPHLYCDYSPKTPQTKKGQAQILSRNYARPIVFAAVLLEHLMENKTI